MKTFLLSLSFTLCFSSIAIAEGLPTYFSIPSNLKGSNISEEAFGEAEFRLPDKDGNLVQGKRWSGDMVMEGVPEDTSGKALWAKVKSSLAKAGWAVVGEYDENPFSATARYKKDKDAWFTATFFSPGDIRFNLVETGGSKAQLKLAAPAATAEKVSPESGDFPYLAPLPGAKLESGYSEPKPFLVTMPGNEEPQIVATGVTGKSYVTPTTISNVEFVSVYVPALKAAGWSVIGESHGVSQSDSWIVAHYDKNGRDIWAHLHYGPGSLTITVADAGKQDIAKELLDKCRVTLTGVLFDFNKASLRPESTAALTRAAGALKGSPKLAVEVQGHTDNVGSDQQNQKLSESRAQSVMKWLVDHGVPASQLTAKGYGKKAPVASNDTVEGRSQNRRVEMACRK